MWSQIAFYHTHFSNCYHFEEMDLKVFGELVDSNLFMVLEQPEPEKYIIYMGK